MLRALHGYVDAELNRTVSELLTALLVHDLNVRPAEHKVVVVEPTIFPLPLKVAICTALAHDARVPAISFVRHAIVACMGAACWTGLVVDVGHRDTRVTPVIHGQAFTPGERGA